MAIIFLLRCLLSSFAVKPGVSSMPQAWSDCSGAGACTKGKPKSSVNVWIHADATDAFWVSMKGYSEQAAGHFGLELIWHWNDNGDQAEAIRGFVDSNEKPTIVTSMPDPVVQAACEYAMSNGGKVYALNNLNRAMFGKENFHAVVAQDDIIAGSVAANEMISLGVTNPVMVDSGQQIGGVGSDPGWSRDRWFGFNKTFVETLGLHPARVSIAYYANKSFSWQLEPVQIFVIDQAILQTEQLPDGSYRKKCKYDGVFLVGNTAQRLAKLALNGANCSTTFFGTVDDNHETRGLIAEGKLSFTINQRAFLQGYVTVALAAFNVVHDTVPFKGGLKIVPLLITDPNAAQMVSPDCEVFCLISMALWGSCGSGQQSLVALDTFSTSVPPQPWDASTPATVCNSDQLTQLSSIIQQCAAASFTFCEMVPCAHGMVFSFTSSTCEPCSSSRVFLAIGDVKECACKAGYVTSGGGTLCTACTSGRFAASPGMTACVECIAGKFSSEAKSTQCTWCSLGEYQQDTGKSECVSCPVGETTILSGLASSTECHCALGKFRPSDGGDCTDCIEGMTCGFASDASKFMTFGGDNERTPLLKPGYFSTSEDPLSVYHCNPEEACPGGIPNSCKGTRRGLVCALCPDDYFANRSNGECGPCAFGVEVGCVALLIPVIASIVMIIWIYNHSYQQIYSDLTNFELVMVLVSILVTVWQLMGTLGHLPLPWPDSSRSQLSIGSFLLFDPESIRAECVIGSSAVLKYVSRLSVPYSFIALVLILWGVSKCLSHATRKCLSWKSDRVANTIGQISSTLFISFASVVALPFQCYSHPNHERSMVSFPQVICFTAEHAPLMSLAVFLLLTFVLPFFVITLWANWTAPSKSVSDASHIVRYYFLLSRFRSNVWWWGSFTYVRQLLFAFSPMVEPDDPYAQVLYVVTVLWAYVALAIYFWPWKSNELNIVETFSLTCMALFAMGSGAFVPKTASPAKYEIAMMMLLATVFSSIGACIVFSFVRFLSVKYSTEVAARTKNSERRAIGTLALFWQRLCLETVRLKLEHVHFLFLAMDKFDRAAVENVIDIFSSLNTHVLEQSGKTVHTRRITNTVSAEMKESHTASDMFEIWKSISIEITGRTGNSKLTSTKLGALCKHAMALGASIDDIECALDESDNPFAHLVELINSLEARDQGELNVDSDLAHRDVFRSTSTSKLTHNGSCLMEPQPQPGLQSLASNQFQAIVKKYIFRIQQV